MKKNKELMDVLNAVKELKEEIKTLSDKLTEFEENKLLTEAQVLKMLDVSPKTLRAYRNDGILAYSRIGNKYFYKLSYIKRMLNYAYVKADNLD